MSRPNKRTKVSASSAATSHCLPFQSGPSLECIPDDVLHEILSHLPTLTVSPRSSLEAYAWPAIPSNQVGRTFALRALSQTSRVLRSRCLALAWRNVELCSVNIVKIRGRMADKVIGDATITATRVLKACPHLLPLIQTVSVVLTSSRPSQVIPRFASYLSKLPNLAAIHVLGASPTARKAIKKGFQGREFPSVRKLSLPCEAHNIIACCPNLEEVINISHLGNDFKIIEPLVRGNSHHLRILKGFNMTPRPHHEPLVGLFPNLTYIGVLASPGWVIKPLADFPLLDTIEISIPFTGTRSTPVVRSVDAEVNEAKEILKSNKSSLEKRVILTRWEGGAVAQQVMKL